MLLTRVGGLACALPIAHVVETMRPLPIEPVSQGSPLGFVRGLAVVRGFPIPVIDTARLLGHTARQQGRFVVVRTTSDDKRVALIVDEVVDVRRIEDAAFAELPPLLRSASAGEVTAIGALDAGLLLALDAGRLVPDDVWASLAEIAR